MSNLNILIVEGNIREDSEFFIKAAGSSAADNLKNLILKIEPLTNTEIINPSHDDETASALKNMSKYNGIVFTGGAMRIFYGTQSNSVMTRNKVIICCPKYCRRHTH